MVKRLFCCGAKVANLVLKTRPRQPAGSLPLDVKLPKFLLARPNLIDTYRQCLNFIDVFVAMANTYLVQCLTVRLRACLERCSSLHSLQNNKLD
jgi:hypothetical protein